MITIYHNPRCSKSRESLELILDLYGEPNIIEYLKQPLEIKEIKILIDSLDNKPGDLIRSAEKIFCEQFASTPLTKNNVAKIITTHPKLMQRPVVTIDNTSIIARPVSKLIDLLREFNLIDKSC